VVSSRIKPIFGDCQNKEHGHTIDKIMNIYLTGHLLSLDDLKTYSSTNYKAVTLLKLTESFSYGICTDLRVNKCKIHYIVNGRYQVAET
jgi:hypothetical protein